MVTAKSTKVYLVNRMTTPTIYEKLALIQSELKAPKNQYNSFGKYNYRNCEDILEAVKPLCKKNRVTLVLSDEATSVDGWHYIKTVASLIDWDSDKCIDNFAFARESEAKKGMDDGQITGSTSSYARKYALNGLFNIDDAKDSDNDATKQEEKARAEKQTQEERSALIDRINKNTTLLQNTYNTDIASEAFQSYVKVKARVDSLYVNQLDDAELHRMDKVLYEIITNKEVKAAKAQTQANGKVNNANREGVL